MDKAHRVPATPATCYTKKEGDFLPQHLLPSQDDLFTPAFRREVKEKESFSFWKKLSSMTAAGCLYMLIIF